MARRKIYDIKPPKMVRQVEEGIKEFLGEEKKPKAKSKRKKEVKHPWLPVYVAGAIIILIAAAYLFFKLPKAEVTIWPKVDTLSFKQIVTADKTASAIDESKFAIPAQYFEDSKTITQEFPATGNADNTGKASGTITVFNKSNITYLKAGTRFVSDSGKLFLAQEKIILPAPKKSGSKVTPSSVEVKVQAAEGGQDYNIAPSNFSIPGLKGTADYYNIYATSSVAMAGGYEGKVKKVTDDDLQGAEDTLVKKATDDAVVSLKKQISSDYILLDNAVSPDTTEKSSDTKAGTTAEKFNYKVTVKVTAIVFKRSDLDKFAKDYILTQVPDGKTLLENSYKINYSAGAVDISGGKAMLNLDFSSGVYQNVDKDSIAISLMGKRADQINQIVSQTLGDQLSKVKINFWPFWVTKAPNSQKAVKVELKFQ